MWTTLGRAPNLLAVLWVVLEVVSVQQKSRPLQQAAERPGLDFKTADVWGFPEADGTQYGPRKAGLLIPSGTGIVLQLKSVYPVGPRLEVSRRSRRGG